MVNNFTGQGFYITLRSLGGSYTTNFAITSTLVFFTSIINSVVLTSFTRRRLTLILAFGMSGVLYGLSGSLTSAVDLQWLQISLAFLGRMCNTLIYQTQYLLANEFFPTNLRARGSTLCATAGRIGAFLSSLAELLRHTMGLRALYFLFGGLGLLTSLCFLLIPELDNRTLPDTVAESKRNVVCRIRQPKPNSPKILHL